MQQKNIPEENKIPVDFEADNLPASAKLFRPLVYQQEELVCVLLGPDEHDGVFASASTIEEAFAQWDNQIQDRVRFHNDEDEVAKYITDMMTASVYKVG